MVEIFNRVAVPGIEIEKTVLQEVISPEASVEIQVDANAVPKVQEGIDIGTTATASEHCIVSPAPVEADTNTFISFQMSSDKPVKGKGRKKEKPIEELVLEECSEESMENIEGGNIVASWSFVTDTGTYNCEEFTSMEGGSINDALLGNTA